MLGKTGCELEAPPAEIEGASRLSLPLASARPGLRAGGGALTPLGLDLRAIAPLSQDWGHPSPLKHGGDGTPSLSSWI